jgi:hypothetical protein
MPQSDLFVGGKGALCAATPKTLLQVNENHPDGISIATGQVNNGRMQFPG